MRKAGWHPVRMPSEDEEIAALRAQLAESRRKLRAKNEKIRELRARTVRPGVVRRLAPLPYPGMPMFFLVGRGSGRRARQATNLRRHRFGRPFPNRGSRQSRCPGDLEGSAG